MRRAVWLSHLVFLALVAMTALACAPGPTPPAPPQSLELRPGGPLWDTPETRRGRALGGLSVERPYPREGEAWVFTGQAPAALTSRPLDLAPGQRYGLSLWVRRDSFVNDHYLWLNFLGQEHRLDAHCVVGGWQKLSVIGVAPPAGSRRIVIRQHTASRLLVGKALVQALPPAAPLSPATPLAKEGFFPLGAYVDTPQHMASAAACGLNTVILGAPLRDTPALLTRAHSLGLKAILFLTADLNSLQRKIALLRGLPPELLPLAFYLKDEPEIRSFDRQRLLAARRLLRQGLPGVGVVTAMVRPGQVGRYAEVYDAVFMDQYPVPSQPLNWLADGVSLAQSQMRPGGQVWAVVQAFGGGKFARMGWPRLPTPAEVEALAASALTAGAQGIAYFHWRYASVDPVLGPALCRLNAKLRRLSPWLPLRPGPPPGVDLKFLGRVSADPGGGPAVRLGWSRTSKGLLLLAVNTTPHAVEISLHGLQGQARQIWSKGNLPVVGGQLRARLSPRQTRAWLFAPTP